MIRKLLAIAFIAIMIYSCENDGIGSNNGIEPDKQETVISLKLDNNIFYGEEQTPMTKAVDENTVKVVLRNSYDAFIAKKIGTRWIFDTLVKTNLQLGNSWNINYKDGTEFLPLKVILTPGDYRISIFLNASSYLDIPQFKKGLVLDDETLDNFVVPKVVKYNVGDLENTGCAFLGNEIFAGTADFTVTKTDSLDLSAINNDRTVLCTRKVANLRYAVEQHSYDIVLQRDSSIANTIHAFESTLTSTVDSLPFPSGLDVWGLPYYDKDEPLRNIAAWTFLDAGFVTSDRNNMSYLLARFGTRVHSTYFFTDPDKEIPYQISNIKVSGNLGTPPYYYRENISSVLKHNTINGYAFYCTAESEGSSQNSIRFLDLLKDPGGTPVNTADLFHDYIEYRGF